MLVAVRFSAVAGQVAADFAALFMERKGVHWVTRDAKSLAVSVRSVIAGEAVAAVASAHEKLRPAQGIRGHADPLGDALPCIRGLERRVVPPTPDDDSCSAYERCENDQKDRAHGRGLLHL